MGKKILGTNIAGILSRSLGPISLSGTLLSVTAGTRNSADLGAGHQPTYTSYPCKGFTDRLDKGVFPDTIIQRSTRAILILGDTVAVVPKVADKITFEGTTGLVVAVERDPDAATYLCAVKD
jgi:hypothetical protein